MRSFEIALLELKRLVSARPFRLAVAVVCLVPLLYGVLYLWAFWDPYQRLDRLPVALVVEDRPAVVAGTTVHVGRDLISQLRRSESLDWELVSARQAADGLKSGRYYMSLTVPRNFSSRLAHADSDHPRRAQLWVKANEGTNLLASQIGQRVFLEVQSSLSRVTSRKYLDRVFVGLGDARTGFERAGRGAGRLAGALGSASFGSRTLARGIGDARTGAQSLRGGLSRLSSGAAKLHSGAASTATGAGRLAAGVRAAGAGARSVATGSETVATGSQSLADGLIQLTSLSQTLASSASSLSGGSSQVQGGVEAAAAKTTEAAAAAGQLSSGAAEVKQALAAFAQTDPDAASDPDFQAALAGAGQVSAGAAAAGRRARRRRPRAADARERRRAGRRRRRQAQRWPRPEYSAAVEKSCRRRAEAVDRRVSALQRSLRPRRRSDRGQRRHPAARRRHVGARRRQRHAGRRSRHRQLRLGLPDDRPRQAGRRRDYAERRLGPRRLRRRQAGRRPRYRRLRHPGVHGKRAPGARGDDERARRRSSPSERTRCPTTAPASRLTSSRWRFGWAPLMAYFLVRPLGGRALASTLRDPYVALSGLWPGVVITWLQAVVMLIVLQVALGLDPVKPVALYAFTLLAALTFAAILQLLSAAFGTAGKFVAVVLLMLQLTSSAGTFPLETVPRFFQVINPLLPMTYVVSGLRQAISGGDLRAVTVDGLILLAYAAAAVGLTVLTTHRRRYVDDGPAQAGAQPLTRREAEGRRWHARGVTRSRGSTRRRSS